MARFGMTAPRASSAIATTAEHRVSNKAGGEAFEISNPSLRLLTMIGSSFWNEPQYYGDNPEAERVAGLSDEASLVINTATEIARSENPRDLLALAAWARTEMNIRTTPQIMLAIAAHEPATKAFVRSYVSRIVQRADELRQVFAAFLSLYAKGVGKNAPKQKLPNSLKRGLADAFGKFSEAQLMKYDSDVRPTFRDVLRMIDRGKDFGLPQPIYRYLVTGEVTDAASVPTIAARKKLASKRELDAEALQLIKASHANWEVVLSQFGKGKKVWEAVLPEMGYMALLRNLRNLIENGVDLTPVLRKLSDADEVKRSRQLPFRFYSAFKTLEGTGKLTGPVRNALEDALSHSVAALPRLPGVTVIASDNSGSMGSPVSAQSVVTRQAVSNLMAAIALRISDDGHVMVFGETAALVPVSARDGFFTNMQKQASTNVGHSTNAHAAVQLMMSKGIKADRLIIFSDMQCWNSSGDANTLNGAVTQYRNKINKNLFVHTVDLAGYGQSPVAVNDPLTNLVSGFSEKILNSVLLFEQARAQTASSTPYREAASRILPSLDDIRARF